ncbi:MAG: hypothetical protein HOH43_19760 [Candidatus Latescibacteria bacterium]|jgi:hypothetical protein|nr:hypothetical protein [Candidatus Latescibacterota bacterium]
MVSMSTIAHELAQIRDRHKQGELTMKDIDQVISMAEKANTKQSILYVQAGSTHPHSMVLGLSIYEEGKNPDAVDEEGNLIYTTLKDALDDGWRIVKFPDMSLVMDEQNTYGLGYEFILERWR